MHRRTALTCHSEERSDVGILQDPAGSLGTSGTNVTAFPRLPRAQRALVMRNLWFSPFNASLHQSAAPRRERHAAPLQWRVRSAGVPPNLQPARRSMSAATDAIGACHSNGSWQWTNARLPYNARPEALCPGICPRSPLSNLQNIACNFPAHIVS